MKLTEKEFIGGEQGGLKGFALGKIWGQGVWGGIANEIITVSEDGRQGLATEGGGVEGTVGREGVFIPRALKRDGVGGLLSYEGLLPPMGLKEVSMCTQGEGRMGNHQRGGGKMTKIKNIGGKPKALRRCKGNKILMGIAQTLGRGGRGKIGRAPWSAAQRMLSESVTKPRGRAGDTQRGAPPISRSKTILKYRKKCYFGTERKERKKRSTGPKTKRRREPDTSPRHTK